MLTDAERAGLKAAFESLCDDYGYADVCKEGPVCFMDGLTKSARRLAAGGCDQSEDALTIFTENRAECERVVAALMGMM
jgi:hypothetical protein